MVRIPDEPEMIYIVKQTPTNHFIDEEDMIILVNRNLQTLLVNTCRQLPATCRLFQTRHGTFNPLILYVHARETSCLELFLFFDLHLSCLFLEPIF